MKLNRIINTQSRTGRALRNTTVTSVCYIAYLLSGFICRTVFTKTLGAEYLGISGLFANILTLLSFAELGIGSALVYRLYAPLAKNERNTVRLYIDLYRRVYYVIILIIAACGVALIPFLKYLVKAPDVKESLSLLYILYLLQTIASYLFVYKKSLLTADQNEHIVSIITNLCSILADAVRSVLLLMTHDFVLYCLIGIVFVLIGNIVCTLYANVKYVFLKEKPVGKISKTEITGLKKDIKGLMLTRVADTALQGTDNIFISAYIGIRYVGILSNYTLILTTVNGLLNKVFGSITAIIGNLGVEENSQSSTETVLMRLFFLNTTIYGYLCAGMILLLREFVTDIWGLSLEFYLPQSVVIIAVVELFLRGIHFPAYTMRTALGLFSQNRAWFVGAAALNILLDFVLVKPWGIAGLYIATILSRGITYCADVIAVYRIGLNSFPARYFRSMAKWLMFLLFCIMVSSFAISAIPEKPSPFMFLLRSVIFSVIYIALFVVFFCKSSEFQYYFQAGKKALKRSGRK